MVSCHAIFLERSPGHPIIVQCRGLAFVRDGVVYIRVYHSVRKYNESLDIDMIVHMIKTKKLLTFPNRVSGEGPTSSRFCDKFASRLDDV